MEAAYETLEDDFRRVREREHDPGLCMGIMGRVGRAGPPWAPIVSQPTPHTVVGATDGRQRPTPLVRRAEDQEHHGVEGLPEAQPGAIAEITVIGHGSRDLRMRHLHEERARRPEDQGGLSCDPPEHVARARSCRFRHSIHSPLQY